MTKQEIKFKTDKYRKARDGASYFLQIYCSKCKKLVLLYQKDGTGSLKRIYLDRIFGPETLVGLEATSLKEITALKCLCGNIIGKPYVYKKETRKAFLLDPHSFTKKIWK